MMILLVVRFRIVFLLPHRILLKTITSCGTLAASVIGHDEEDVLPALAFRFLLQNRYSPAPKVLVELFVAVSDLDNPHTVSGATLGYHGYSFSAAQGFVVAHIMMMVQHRRFPVMCGFTRAKVAIPSASARPATPFSAEPKFLFGNEG